jgi:hypothetical protein
MNEILRLVGGVLCGKEYRFDSETEEMLYADQLQNGMVVLVQASLRRSPNSDPFEVEKYNLWCEVSKFRTSNDGTQVHFVGIYANGDQHFRQQQATQGFLVQKESITADMWLVIKRREQMMQDEENGPAPHINKMLQNWQPS